MQARVKRDDAYRAVARFYLSLSALTGGEGRGEVGGRVGAYPVNACSPVCARPNISACTSCVPS